MQHLHDYLALSMSSVCWSLVRYISAMVSFCCTQKCSNVMSTPHNVILTQESKCYDSYFKWVRVGQPATDPSMYPCDLYFYCVVMEGNLCGYTQYQMCARLPEVFLSGNTASFRSDHASSNKNRRWPLMVILVTGICFSPCLQVWLDLLKPVVKQIRSEYS